MSPHAASIRNTIQNEPSFLPMPQPLPNETTLTYDPHTGTPWNIVPHECYAESRWHSIARTRHTGAIR